MKVLAFTTALIAIPYLASADTQSEIQLCQQISWVSGGIISGHLRGEPRDTWISMLSGGEPQPYDQQLLGIIIEAYELPIPSSQSEKEQLQKDFTEAVLTDCLNNISESTENSP